MNDVNNELISLTAEIVSAHLANNHVNASEVPGLIHSVHQALVNVTTPAKPEQAKQEPAVPIRSSVKNDHIVCLEDGKKLKMLKRYLRTNYNMTPDEYRAKWDLPRDYPMVAPAYAEQRRGLAHQIGLGRKKVGAAVEAVEDAAKNAGKRVSAAVTNAAAAARSDGGEQTAPKRRGRPKKEAVANAEA